MKKTLKNMTVAELTARMEELWAEDRLLLEHIDAARRESDAHCKVKDALYRDEMRPIEKELLAITKAVVSGDIPEQSFSVAFDKQRALLSEFESMCAVQMQHYLTLQALHARQDSIDRKMRNVQKKLRACTYPATEVHEVSLPA